MYSFLVINFTCTEIETETLLVTYDARRVNTNAKYFHRITLTLKIYLSFFLFPLMLFIYAYHKWFMVVEEVSFSISWEGAKKLLNWTTLLVEMHNLTCSSEIVKKRFSGTNKCKNLSSVYFTGHDIIKQWLRLVWGKYLIISFVFLDV
jgi:hypothetical protein